MIRPLARGAWLPIVLASSLLLPVRAAPDAVPKADTNVINLVNDAGRFQAVHDEVRPQILALADAKGDAGFETALDAFTAKYGKRAVEVLVRYREPHMVPVFARLTEASEWYVRRLAVLGLQHNFAFAEMDRVVALLADENALVREIAAMTVAILHEIAAKHKKTWPDDRDVKAAAKEMKSRRKADEKALLARLEAEENEFVRAALEASVQVLGRRRLLRIHTEPTVEDEPGRYVPRLEGGMVNAYQQGSGVSSSGSGRLRPTSGWGYPVLLYPREVFSTTSDAPLVPLPQKRDSFHYGHDCGWFLEGSGIYAVADGVVRWIRSGGDWGGLVVTEHMDEDREKIAALNGHCGTWVFVEGGEDVKKGQLLAQMGLSFSAENGGHGAHDHFGLYTGGFSEGHCYGRGAEDRTQEGWLIPADFLTPRVDGERLPPDSYR